MDKDVKHARHSNVDQCHEKKQYCPLDIRRIAPKGGEKVAKRAVYGCEGRGCGREGRELGHRDAPTSVKLLQTDKTKRLNMDIDKC